MEEPVRIDQCNSIRDFRLMARRRLPGPIFHYIDGAADDEVTYRRNTKAYERCDLVPNVLAGVESIDMSQAAPCSPRSTPGSPKASTPPTSRTPRRCSTNY